MDHKHFNAKSAAEYVEVVDEPMHKEIYADRHFRAYCVNLSPGQVTQYHRHSEDTIYLVLRGGRMISKTLRGHKRSLMVFPRSFSIFKKLGLVLQNALTGSVHFPAGLFYVMPTQKHPFFHLAAASSHNRGEASLMGIEIQHGSAVRVPAPRDIFPWRIEYKGGTILVLTCSFPDATRHGLALPGYSLFMVCIAGSLEVVSEHAIERAPHRLVKADFLCISGEYSVQITNSGSKVAEMMVIALSVDD